MLYVMKQKVFSFGGVTRLNMRGAKHGRSVRPYMLIESALL